MKTKSILTTAVLALGLISSASAATFSFGGGAGDGVGTNTMNFSSTPVGTTVSVTAWTTSNQSTFSQVSVGQYSGGLGVKNSSGDAHTVDNSGNIDMLLFAFSGPVTLTNLSIGYVSGDSDFKYWVGNTNNVATLFGSSGTVVNGGSNPASYGISGGGNYLLVSAKPGDWNDSFKLSGLTFTTNSNIPGTPDAGSTLAIFGLALAGLAAAKRRFQS